jgi:hypothetical protein
VSAKEERAYLTKILHWVRGERALATAFVRREPRVPYPLAGLEVAEQLSGLLASTSPAQTERVKRLVPSMTEEPIPLLAAARSLRFYLPLEPGETFEIEAVMLQDGGELASVHFEARLTSGERVATGELRYLLVPPTDHEREVRARAELKARLAWDNW